MEWRDDRGVDDRLVDGVDLALGKQNAATLFLAADLHHLFLHGLAASYDLVRAKLPAKVRAKLAG